MSEKIIEYGEKKYRLADLITMDFGDLTDNIDGFTYKEKINLLKEIVVKDGENAINSTIYRETLVQLLENDNNLLAKCLIPKGCIYRGCFIDLNTGGHCIQYEDTNLKIINIALEKISLDEIDGLYTDLEKGKSGPIGTMRALIETKRFADQIVAGGKLIKGTLVTNALGTNLQKGELLSLATALEKVLLVTRQQTSLAYSDIGSLNIERGWTIKVVEGGTLVYLADNKGMPVSLDGNGHFYIGPCEKGKNIYAYNCIMSTNSNTIATCHGEDVSLSYIDQKTLYNKIKWKSKGGIIDKEICEVATKILLENYNGELVFDTKKNIYMLFDTRNCRLATFDANGVKQEILN